MGATQKSLPMDPSSIYGQAILQSKSGLGSAGSLLPNELVLLLNAIG